MRLKLPTIIALFAVIILEGYVVLSSELLAIRQTIPYTGSGTETISIIIAAVLMPLAFGYYAAGKFKPSPKRSIRQKLIFNIVLSMLFLLPALSYIILEQMHAALLSIGVSHRLLVISLYAVLFMAPPVYLLGQTIPLISNYFGKERLSKITGLILSFSTFGSFMGAVFSTLVLMATIGVNNTVIINFVILFTLTSLLSKNKFSPFVLCAFVITVLAAYINSSDMMRKHNVLYSNQYNTIGVVEKNGDRHLLINNSYSSMFNKEGRKYKYIELAEDLAIKPIMGSTPPKDILVIGAGAFTFGFDDQTNIYDFIDIDPSLKDTAEDYILLDEISENKTFHPVPARGFLAETSKKYDVILLDTYFGRNTLPEHLITADFFETVKSHMKDNAVMIGNFIGSPNFNDPFSRNLDNTVRSVFPYVSRHVMQNNFAPWNDDKTELGNIIYIYRHRPNFGTPSIYTDNKNRSYLDRP